MTLNRSASPAISDHNAPYLPEDKARASELFNQVKGTDREQAYREISLRHADKEANRATYRAFLDDIETLFVDACSGSAGVADFHPNMLTESAEDHEVVEEADPSDAEIEHHEQESGESLPPAICMEQTAILPLAGSGLISQLAGMLAEGGQLSFTMMRLGDEVTLSISPKPHGTESVVPLLLTNTPAYLDEHLVVAMQPYAEVRRDIYVQCSAAAKAQRKAGEKVAPASTSPKAGSDKGSPTYTLTLDGMPGTTFTATNSGKSVDVALGVQAVKPGMTTITARHPLYGEHTKTLMMTANRTHDFREQQGAMMTLEVLPESAAITAIQGDVRMALHREGFLAPGKWVIEAEADGHTKQSKAITVVAAKTQTVTLTLPVEHEQPLF